MTKASEIFTNIGAIRLPEYISPEPRSQTSLLPRGLPGQAMAVSHGSCRGRALRRPNTRHSVSPKSSYVRPYPRGPQAYEEPLPAPIKCCKVRSKWAVRFFCERKLLWDILECLREIRFGLGLLSRAIHVHTFKAESVFELLARTQMINFGF